MRPVVSYGDISPPVMTTEPSPPRPPPSKRRKKSNQRPPQHVQHWDDPGNADEAMLYDDLGTTGADMSSVKYEGEIEENEEGEESRELTYEEIWDDSALINAWNAATEEYEFYHGTDKSWKKEPVNKSPLWYNIPPSPSQLKKSTTVASAGPASTPHAAADKQRTDDNSHPLNFDTFIPAHDPSLTLPVPPYPHGQVPDYSGYSLPEPPGPMVSQDEAFTRAMGAMYWAGYYSAVYHCHRNIHLAKDENEEQEYENDQIEKQEEEDETLIPTQR
ncbi:hypothetical protein PILCRDRAFT_485730 [Piloderma croceum F 1598]|uniref:Survival Motor Neuron Gemin2-binding domain-containing protein n=1 Tax=Piloderma croceum (strain F 1598) TaxID=765440 RepID=A0A0C3BWF7_PILCF|nr:hypothetical protein PILCRDRAFT_485730 [Piloderma croceum F 1598]